ncbi:zinc ABC transporter substrate-binding protein ZnuA [Pantoea sp. Aalb]|uniref:zinc ABC transporter substrate-binding protein ZnuA n=1 Tax=Pantoea sp. Aalb TaxID=2576762 RepID=UPI0013233748|nr:zinc ABC transporter substrate-binding protein ZnuA [Pantoea sp. Aalb]MXP67365.1 zinc ABC transporter substrate-binding protein ZnuA [Pantoea sp. Aalb]
MLHNKNLILILYTVIITNFYILHAHSKIIVSIKPIGFIVAAIADDIIPVEVLIPDGVSEHNYVLRPSDIRRIKNANLIVWNGPEIEFFLAKLASELPAEKKLIITNISALKSLFLKTEDKKEKNNTINYHTSILNCCNNNLMNINTHIWMSPEIAKQSAIAIHKKLLEILPNYKIKLDINLKHFEELLNTVDKYIEEQLTVVRNKGYFVFHDAYSYFEKHYHLSPLGYFTINPDIQPGLKHLYQIRKQLIKKKAICIFTEPQFTPSIINAVSRGIKINKAILDPLGININLSKDSYTKFLLQLSNQYKSCLLKD